MLADTETFAELKEALRSFVALCVSTQVRFDTEGLMAELSIGFSVGDSERFIAGVVFSATDLRQISDIGISLDITAYPTSDAANAAN